MNTVDGLSGLNHLTLMEYLKSDNSITFMEMALCSLSRLTFRPKSFHSDELDYILSKTFIELKRKKFFAVQINLINSDKSTESSFYATVNHKNQNLQSFLSFLCPAKCITNCAWSLRMKNVLLLLYFGRHFENSRRKSSV